MLWIDLSFYILIRKKLKKRKDNWLLSRTVWNIAYSHLNMCCQTCILSHYLNSEHSGTSRSLNRRLSDLILRVLNIKVMRFSLYYLWLTFVTLFLFLVCLLNNLCSGSGPWHTVPPIGTNLSVKFPSCHLVLATPFGARVFKMVMETWDRVPNDTDAYPITRRAQTN